MWGSSVGLVISLIILFIVWGIENPCSITLNVIYKILVLPVVLICKWRPFELLSIIGLLLIFVGQSIYGFLIGWGTHSLIRNLRKG